MEEKKKPTYTSKPKSYKSVKATGADTNRFPVYKENGVYVRKERTDTGRDVPYKKFSWSDKSSTKELSFPEYFAWGQHTGKGQEFFAKASEATKNPASRYYNPYFGKSTTQTAAQQFFAENFDYDGAFDDNFFRDFQFLRAHETRSDVTGGIQQPLKKTGTTEQWAAYWYTQLLIDKDIQHNADTEWGDLRSYAADWYSTQRMLGKTPSAEEFIGAIDMSRYSTLSKIDASRNFGEIDSSAVVQLNLGTNYSRESLYGLYNVLASGGDISQDRDYFGDAIKHYSEPIRTAGAADRYYWQGEGYNLSSQPEAVAEYENHLRASGSKEELTAFQYRLYTEGDHMASVDEHSYFAGQYMDDAFFEKYDPLMNPILAEMMLSDRTIKKPEKGDLPRYHMAYEYYLAKKKLDDTQELEGAWSSVAEMAMRILTKPEDFSNLNYEINEPKDLMNAVEEQLEFVGLGPELTVLRDYMENPDPSKLCRINFISQDAYEGMFAAAFHGFDVSSNDIDYAIAKTTPSIDSSSAEAMLAPSDMSIFDFEETYINTFGQDQFDERVSLQEHGVDVLEYMMSELVVEQQNKETRAAAFSPDGVFMLPDDAETPDPDPIVEAILDREEALEASSNALQFADQRAAVEAAVLSFADSPAPIAASDIEKSGLAVVPSALADTDAPALLLELWKGYRAPKYGEVLGSGYTNEQAMASDPVLKALSGASGESVAVTFGSVGELALSVNSSTLPSDGASLASGVLDIVVPESRELSRLMIDLSLELEPDQVQAVLGREFDAQTYASAISEAKERGSDGRTAVAYAISKMGMLSDFASVLETEREMTVGAKALALELCSPEAVENIHSAFGGPVNFVKAQAMIGGTAATSQTASMGLFAGLLAGQSEYADDAYRVVTADVLHDMMTGDITMADIVAGIKYGGVPAVEVAGRTRYGVGVGRPTLVSAPPVAEPDADVEAWSGWGDRVSAAASELPSEELRPSTAHELPSEDLRPSTRPGLPTEELRPPELPPAPDARGPRGSMPPVPTSESEAQALTLEMANAELARLDERIADVEARFAEGAEAAQQDLGGIQVLAEEYEYRLQMGEITPAERDEFVAALYADSEVADRDALQAELQSLRVERDRLFEQIWYAEREAKYSQIEQAADYAELSEVVDEDAVPENVFARTFGNFDSTYAYINDIRGYRDSYDMSFDKGPDDPANDKFIYTRMSDNQVKRYRYLYQKEGRESAEDYLGFVVRGLNAQVRAEQDERLRALVNSGLGGTIAANVASVFTSMVRGIGTIDALIQRGSGEPLDMNTPAQMFGAATDVIRGQTSENVSGHLMIGDFDVWNTLYGVGMSGIDSQLAGLIGGGGGVGGAILGLSAAQGAMQQASDDGATDTQIVQLGLAAGIFEYAFESISLGYFYKGLGDGVTKVGAKAALTDFLAQGGINASEELATEFANILWDYHVRGDESDFGFAVNQYVASGMSWEEARAAASKDMAMRLGESGLSGLLMGFGFSGLSTFTRNRRWNKADRAYRAAREAAAESTGAQIIESGEDGKLVDMAKSGQLGVEAQAIVGDYDPATKNNTLIGQLFMAGTEHVQKTQADMLDDAKRNATQDIAEAMGADNAAEIADEVLEQSKAQAAMEAGQKAREGVQQAVEQAELPKPAPAPVEAAPPAPVEAAPITAPEAQLTPIQQLWADLSIGYVQLQQGSMDEDAFMALRERILSDIKEEAGKSDAHGSGSIDAPAVLDAPVPVVEVAPPAVPTAGMPVVSPVEPTEGMGKVVDFLAGVPEGIASTADRKDGETELALKIEADPSIASANEQILTAERQKQEIDNGIAKLEAQGVRFEQNLEDAYRAGVDDGITTQSSPKFAQVIQNINRQIQSNITDRDQAMAKSENKAVEISDLIAKRDEIKAEIERQYRQELEDELVKKKQERAAKRAEEQKKLYEQRVKELGSFGAAEELTDPNPDYEPGNRPVSSPVGVGASSERVREDTKRKDKRRGEEDSWEIDTEEEMTAPKLGVRGTGRMVEVGKEAYNQIFRDLSNAGDDVDENLFQVRRKGDNDIVLEESQGYNEKGLPYGNVWTFDGGQTEWRTYLEGNGYLILKNEVVSDGLAAIYKDIDKQKIKVWKLESSLEKARASEKTARESLKNASGKDTKKLQLAHAEAKNSRELAGAALAFARSELKDLNAKAHEPVVQFMAVKAENILALQLRAEAAKETLAIERKNAVDAIIDRINLDGGEIVREHFPDYDSFFDLGLSPSELKSKIMLAADSDAFEAFLPQTLGSMIDSVKEAEFATAREAKEWASEHGIKTEGLNDSPELDAFKKNVASVRLQRSTPPLDIWQTRHGMGRPRTPGRKTVRITDVAPQAPQHYFVDEALYYREEADKFEADLDTRREEAAKGDSSPTIIKLDGNDWQVLDEDKGTMLLIPTDSKQKQGAVKTLDDAIKVIESVHASIDKARQDNSFAWRSTIPRNEVRRLADARAKERGYYRSDDFKANLDFESAISYAVYEPSKMNRDKKTGKINEYVGGWVFLKLGWRNLLGENSSPLNSTRHYADLNTILSSPRITVRYNNKHGTENFTIINKEMMEWKEGTFSADLAENDFMSASERPVYFMLRSKLAEARKVLDSKNMTVSEFKESMKDYLRAMQMFDKKKILDRINRIEDGVTKSRQRVLEKEIRGLEHEIEAIDGVLGRVNEMVDAEVSPSEETLVHRLSRELEAGNSNAYEQGGGALMEGVERSYLEATSKASAVESDDVLAPEQRSINLRFFAKRAQEMKAHYDAMKEAGITRDSPSAWADEQAEAQGAERQERLSAARRESAQREYDSMLAVLEHSNESDSTTLLYNRQRLMEIAASGVDASAGLNLVNALADSVAFALPISERAKYYTELAREAELIGDEQTLAHANARLEETVLRNGVATTPESIEGTPKGTEGTPEASRWLRIRPSDDIKIKRFVRSSRVAENLERMRTRMDEQMTDLESGNRKNKRRAPTVLLSEVVEAQNAIGQLNSTIEFRVSERNAIREKLYNKDLDPSVQSRINEQLDASIAKANAMDDALLEARAEVDGLVARNEALAVELRDGQAELTRLESELAVGNVPPSRVQEVTGSIGELGRSVADTRSEYNDNHAAIQRLRGKIREYTMRRTVALNSASDARNRLYSPTLELDERKALMKKHAKISREIRRLITERDAQKAVRNKANTELLMDAAVMNLVLTGDMLMNPSMPPPTESDQVRRDAEKARTDWLDSVAPKLRAQITASGNQIWQRVNAELLLRIRDGGMTSFTIPEIAQAVHKAIPAEHFKFMRDAANALRSTLYEYKRGRLYAQLELAVLREISGQMDTGMDAARGAYVDHRIALEKGDPGYSEANTKAEANIAVDRILNGYRAEHRNADEATINRDVAFLADSYLRSVDSAIEVGEKAMKTLYADSTADGLEDALRRGHLPTSVKAMLDAALREVADTNRNPGSHLSMALQQPREVVAKMMGKNVATAALFNSLFVNQALHGEAEAESLMAEYRERLRKAGLTKDIQQDVFVYIDEYKMDDSYFDGMDKKAAARIKRAATELHTIYEDVFAKYNERARRNGVAEIDHRQFYQPHIPVDQSFIERFKRAKRGQDRSAAIEGRTKEFAPSKMFNPHAQRRHGNMPYSLNAIDAFESFMSTTLSAMTSMDSIIRLRDLEQLLRATMDYDDRGMRTDAARNRLSKFSAWTHQYANQIAGKKGAFDYELMQHTGRASLIAFNQVKKLRGQSLILGNVRAAMQNLIPLTQVGAVHRRATLKALGQTIGQFIVDRDGFRSFENESAHLRTQFGSKPLGEGVYERAVRAGMLPMFVLDRFARNVVVRSLYIDGRSKGYSHDVAMARADSLAHDMMTTKTRAGSANIYSTTTGGIVLQFTQEAVNHVSWMISGLPRSVDDPLAYGFAMLLMMLFGWGYNVAAGTSAAPDPIGAGIETANKIKDGDAPVLAILEGISDAFNPFNRLLSDGSGGIPIVSGIEDIVDAFGYLLGDGDPQKALVELGEAAMGFVPFGASAMRAYDGISDVARGYDTTKGGNIKFPLSQGIDNYAYAALFGTSFTGEGRDYAGRTPKNIIEGEGPSRALNASQTAEFMRQLELGIPAADAYEDILATTKANELGSDQADAERGMRSEAGALAEEAAAAREGVTLPSGMADWAYRESDSAPVQNAIAIWRESGSAAVLPRGFEFSAAEGDDGEEVLYFKDGGHQYVPSVAERERMEAAYKRAYLSVLGAAYTRFDGDPKKISGQLEKNRNKIKNDYIAGLREVG